MISPFLKRTIIALFGGVVFAIILPVSWLLIFKSLPGESFTAWGLFIGACFVVGAILGTLFPKVFGFFLVLFLDEI